MLDWSLEQSFKVPSALLPSSPSTDHLSLALHTLSQSPLLTHLDLSCAISPCFFWPECPSAADSSFWPSLQHLLVWFGDIAPNGNRLFLKDTNGFDDDETIARSSFAATENEPDDSIHFSDSDSSESAYVSPQILDPEKINPMLMAMARAAIHMPKIKELSLFCPSPFGGLAATYLAGGQTSRFGLRNWEEEEMEKNRWHIFTDSESKWTLPDELKTACEAVGSPGDEVVIKHDES